jgi:hypothetical protein
MRFLHLKVCADRLLRPLLNLTVHTCYSPRPSGRQLLQGLSDLISVESKI